MRIGTRKYYADITASGVSIFSHGVKKNFYPWGSGKDAEARETANNALELAENSVKKTADIAETQTAGYNLVSQPVEGSPNGWVLETSDTSAKIGINSRENGCYASIYNGATQDVVYIVNRRPDKPGGQIGATIKASADGVEEYLVDEDETSRNQIYLRGLPNLSRITLTNTNLADNSRSTMDLMNRAQVSTNAFYFSTTFKPNANVDEVYCRIYFDTLTITMRKGSESRTLDLWELAAPPATE